MEFWGNSYQFAAPGVYDADAADYIARVNAVDAANGQAGGLESGLQDIIHILFHDLKLDASPFAGVSNFAALKGANLYCAARTRQGAMVPLLSSMPTPTTQGTAGNWNYNRKTGLRSGTGNYTETNRSITSDPRNNAHISVFLTETAPIPTGSICRHIGAANPTGGAEASYTLLATLNLTAFSGVSAYVRGQNFVKIGNLGATGFVSGVRTSLTSSQGRCSGVSTALTDNSILPSPSNIITHGLRLAGTDPLLYEQRLSWQSTGEAVNDALLDSRITAFMTALSALTLT